MPVDSEHSEYEKFKAQWEKCRDTIEGSYAVKERRQDYLPLLDDQTVSEYDAYLLRALFYGASGRTVQGLLGAIFRKDPIVKIKEEYLEFLKTITAQGLSIADLSRKILEEILTSGRVGLLVDVDETITDKTEPYISYYLAENIINWKTQRMSGKNELSLIVLKEVSKVSGEDFFEEEEEVRYRVLELRKVKGKVVYMQTLYKKQKTSRGTTFVILKKTVPTKNGKQLDRIPFVIINTTNLLTTVNKPPLLDLVEVNLSHYRTSADLEHGAHYTALPTAYLAGFTVDGTQDYRIGSRTAWVSDDPAAKAGFLEFTGQGLDSLRNLKSDKEKLMAVLGARLLEESKRAAEAAETLRLRHSGESGSLSTIANTAEEGITKALQLVAWWMSIASYEKVAIELNKDFISDKLDADYITTLMNTWQSGGISQDTFLYNLKAGEILPPDTSIEDEKNLIGLEFGNGFGDSDDVNITPVKRSFKLVKDDNGDSTISEV